MGFQEKSDPTAELKMPSHLENLEAGWLVGWLVLKAPLGECKSPIGSMGMVYLPRFS